MLAVEISFYVKSSLTLKWTSLIMIVELWHAFELQLYINLLDSRDWELSGLSQYYDSQQTYKMDACVSG